jgi:hypothetical protein
MISKKEQTKTNSVALARERTIPTERPPLIGEVSANFGGYRVSHGRRNGSPRPKSRLSRPGVKTSSWKKRRAVFTVKSLHFGGRHSKAHVTDYRNDLIKTAFKKTLILRTINR